MKNCYAEDVLKTFSRLTGKQEMVAEEKYAALQLFFTVIQMIFYNESKKSSLIHNLTGNGY